MLYASKMKSRDKLIIKNKKRIYDCKILNEINCFFLLPHSLFRVHTVEMLFL